MKKLISLFMALALCFSVCACGGNNSDKKLLKVSVFAAGFGRSWLDKTAEAYMEQNPDVYVKIAATTGMESTAQGALESGRTQSLSDIYSCVSLGNYFVNIREGRLLNLNSLYEVEVDGETLKDKIDPSVEPLVKQNGNYYAVPWNASVTSIAYNDKMFAQNGWSVPTTMDEFYALCDKITKESSAYAIGYVGGAGCDGYLEYIFSTLAFQYEGMAGYNEFYEFDSANVYKQEGRAKAYEAIGKIITGVGKSSTNNDKTWTYPGTNTADNENIQKKFFNGEIAMLINGSWLLSEMKDYLPLYPNFSCKMMQLPWISTDKTSKDGGTTNMNTSECTLLVIPANCANPELAQDFINFMNSDAMLKVYTQETNNVRPFTYDGVDLGNLDGWTQSIVDVYKNSTNIYGISDNTDFRLGRLKTLMIQDIIPYFDGKSSSDILDIVDNIMNYETNYASEFFK